MVHGEIVTAIIRCRFPSIGRVAVCAGLPREKPKVITWVGVTGATFLGCALEHTVRVAFCAGDIGMCAAQLKSRQVVIETGRPPGLGRMAGRAVLAKLTIVLIILLVAGITIGRCAFEGCVCMAFPTACIAVCASQFKSGTIMVKGRRFPGLGGVTCCTVLAQ